MECLHGKPTSCSTTKNGSFWFCGQNPSCGFICTEDESYVFQRGLEAWRNTNVKQPTCESHQQPARFRVVNDLQKDNYGRPYFTCADRQNPCPLWMWADENQIEKPDCYHGQSAAMKRVKTDGPNKRRLFFCCASDNSCRYFQWVPEQPVKSASRVEDPFKPLFYNDFFENELKKHN